MNYNDAEYKVAQVVATLAISGMHVSKEFREELLLMAQGKKTSKELLEDLNDKYKSKE